MSIDIQAIKNRSKTDLEKLSQGIENDGKSSYKPDERYWKLDPDNDGKGSATIRFLPALEDDQLPWVVLFSHYFKNPKNGLIYSENSRTTLPEAQDNRDPVSELNLQLYNSGIKANKELASSRRRNRSYISNILVIDDTAHPENNGKVFLFRYGKKIYTKIKNMAHPPVDDITPVNIFCYFQGADFRLISVSKNPDRYDNSVFKKPSLIGTDERIQEIAEQQYDLQALIHPDQFKSYDELKAKLDNVLGSSATRKSDEITEEMLPENYASKKVAPHNPDSDDPMEYFQDMANEES